MRHTIKCRLQGLSISSLKWSVGQSGGPQKYTGRSMRESHEQLNITPKEWDAFMDDFQQSLDKFNVPAAEQAELKAIVQSTYGDIVIGEDKAPATASTAGP